MKSIQKKTILNFFINNSCAQRSFSGGDRDWLQGHVLQTCSDKMLGGVHACVVMAIYRSFVLSKQLKCFSQAGISTTNSNWMQLACLQLEASSFSLSLSAYSCFGELFCLQLQLLYLQLKFFAHSGNLFI